MGRAITKPTLVSSTEPAFPYDPDKVARLVEHGERFLDMEEDIRAAMRMARIVEVLADRLVDQERECFSVDRRDIADLAFAAAEARRYATNVQAIFSSGAG